MDFSFKMISEIKSREKNWIKKTSEENDRKWIERIDNCTAPLWNENVMHFETKSTRIHLHLTLKNSYLPTVVSRLEYTVQIVSKLKLIFTMQLTYARSYFSNIIIVKLVRKTKLLPHNLTPSGMTCGNRGNFYKTQWAGQGAKITRLMSIFTSKKVGKFLKKNQLTKSDPKRTRG